MFGIIKKDMFLKDILFNYLLLAALIQTGKPGF